MKQFTEEDIKKAFLEGVEWAQDAASIQYGYGGGYITFDGNEYEAAAEYVENVKCSP